MEIAVTAVLVITAKFMGMNVIAELLANVFPELSTLV
jgi:hypothetical protein